MYCYHEIVHNRLVVQRFQEAGVIFVDDIADIQAGRPIMLSAHGSAPRSWPRHANRAATSSAVCPLVTKVHHEVKTRAKKGYQIVYIGHEGHEEAVSTMAVAPRSSTGWSPRRGGSPAGPRSARCRPRPDHLSHREWAGVLNATRERFPDLWQPGRSDLCFATTNRQSALMEIAPRCDAMVVIGSANPPAPMRWPDSPRRPAVGGHRINGPDELPDPPRSSASPLAHPHQKTSCDPSSTDWLPPTGSRKSM